jgi:hypothetical protein
MAFQIDIKDADQFKREILETTSTLQGAAAAFVLHDHMPSCTGGINRQRAC